MAILLNNNGYGNQAWQAELAHLLPDMPVRLLGEVGDPGEIRYALVWDHPKGDLQRYPNLKAILSLGAGVEHLAADPDLPDLPVVRLADPAVARDMALHTLHWVIRFHRHYPDYDRQQRDGRWARQDACPVEEFTVGVLGLGNIGSRVADCLALNGYPVHAWDLVAASPNPEVSSFTGDELDGFLAGIRVVVNCLPLTDQTRGLIDDDFLSKLQPGCFVINISRGAVVEENALLSALESGRIKAAALDAFDLEPLPREHPFWGHADIHVTPHMSGATSARSAARVLVANIRRIEAGEEAFPLYDRQRGY